MLTRFIRWIRIKLLQGRVDVLGQLAEELQGAGRDSHRVARMRAEAARTLAGLRAQALQERVHAAF